MTTKTKSRPARKTAAKKTRVVAPAAAVRKPKVTVHVHPKFAEFYFGEVGNRGPDSRVANGSINSDAFVSLARKCLELSKTHEVTLEHFGTGPHVVYDSK